MTSALLGCSLTQTCWVVLIPARKRKRPLWVLAVPCPVGASGKSEQNQLGGDHQTTGGGRRDERGPWDGEPGPSPPPVYQPHALGHVSSVLAPSRVCPCHCSMDSSLPSVSLNSSGWKAGLQGVREIGKLRRRESSSRTADKQGLSAMVCEMSKKGTSRAPGDSGFPGYGSWSLRPQRPLCRGSKTQERLSHSAKHAADTP